MSETYTPVPAAPPATWTLPNNTELADAEALKTDVLKKEADNLAYFEEARVLLASSIAAYRNQRPSVQIVGTAASIGTFAGYFPSSNAILNGGGSTYTLAALGNNAWYYVYWNTSAFLTSTTGPDATLQHKTGDPDQMYLFCFRTDGAATPYAVRSVGGRYLYEDQHSILIGGNSTTYATLSLASYVPPHARSARLWASFYEGTTPPNAMRIRPKYSAGSSASSGAMIVLVDLIGSSNSLESEVGVEQGQGVEYKVDSDTGTTSATIAVTGFAEAV